MRTVERDLDLILTRLRNAIRECGFTQLEVQEVLGWGKSYISQLLTKQKSLRIEQILLMLNVIGLDPGVFFGDIYPFGEGEPATPRRKGARPAAGPHPPSGLDEESPFVADVRRLRLMLERVVSTLIRKNLITTTDLARAVEEAKRELRSP